MSEGRYDETLAGEDGFHWLGQILIFYSYELNLGQDRLTCADRQLKIEQAKFSPGQVNISVFTAA